MNALIPLDTIESRILFVRGQIVILNAQLYAVETRVLNQAVRNEARLFDHFIKQYNFKLSR